MLVKKYVCRYCGKLFIDRRAYGQHVLVTHSICKYTCKYCNKVFSHKGNFNKHENACSHRPQVPYYCESCGKLVTVLYGSGRFCSASCGNKRTHTQESKNKIVESLRAYYTKRGISTKIYTCGVCGKKISYGAKLCIACSNKSIAKRTKISISHKHKVFFSLENSDKKFYGYIYCTINVKNGFVYIGQHFTDNGLVKRAYYGSGIYIRRAIKKYGKSIFKKEIICSGMYTTVELNELERYYIWLATHSPDIPGYYNIAIGGRGNTVCI